MSDKYYLVSERDFDAAISAAMKWGECYSEQDWAWQRLQDAKDTCLARPVTLVRFEPTGVQFWAEIKGDDEVEVITIDESPECDASEVLKESISFLPLDAELEVEA